MVKIKKIENEENTKEKPHSEAKERPGLTVITSASLGGRVIPMSVSVEFKKIMDEYHLSPTDMLRKGIAITMYEIGQENYQTQTNARRLEFYKQFMAKLFELDEKWDMIKTLTIFAEEIIKLKPLFDKIQEET